MLYQATEDFNNLEVGLEKRGFIGMNGIDSMGKCHLNEKHYVLRTDGLVIYSNFPWTHTTQEWLGKKDYRETWGMEEFTFEKLDEVMKMVDL